MTPRRPLHGIPHCVPRNLLLAALFVIVLSAVQACAPAMTPTQAPAPAQPTVTSAAAQAAEATATSAPAARPTQVETRPAIPTGQPAQVVEGRQVELEWPARLRLGDSDVIRLALVPTKSGYVAQAEFPDHTLQTREVPVPRPNGYTLYAIARLDGVGFDLSPGGDQERFVPAGEEVAWRWTIAPRKPGQQRLSVQLRLRWVPGPGVTGEVRESQAYARGLDVQISSFFGLSPAQAASTGLLGLLLGSGFLLAALVGRRARIAEQAGARFAGPRTLNDTSHEILQTVSPVAGLAIESPSGLALAPLESGLLSGLFHSYSRLVIENEFLSGYSGARTFLVRPIRPDGCADALTIVKLGPREAIRQEFENYERFVKDRLPPMTARIQRPPVTLSGDKRPASGKTSGAGRAAVQYTFIAEPGHPPVSLRQALLQDPDPRHILRLFETFGPNWWMQRRPYTFRMGLECDCLLPPHYVLEPLWDTRPRTTQEALTEKDDPAGLDLSVEDLIPVLPFHQAELRADGQSFTLTGLPAAGQPALRVRWLSTKLPRLPNTPARVVSTRIALLREWTRQFDLFGLPDPLDTISAALKESVAGTRSVIHGDLNLENVLVGPGSLVWLIDFAQTREGHPLFDFAHLASELIAHVLAVRAGSARSYLDLWQSGADPLLITIEQVAGRCLFDPARPREYHLALYLACLGALKYQNLGGLAKHCLYLTAADIGAKAIV